MYVGIIVIASTSNLFSQSKSDTQNWLISKFELYGRYYTNDLRNIRFNDCEMSYNTTITFIDTDNRGKENVMNMTIKIPFDEVKAISYKDDPVFINAYTFTILMKEGKPYKEVKEGKESLLYKLSFQIHPSDNEPDIQKRISKALNHLVKICGGGQNIKEVF